MLRTNELLDVLSLLSQRALDATSNDTPANTSYRAFYL